MKNSGKIWMWAALILLISNIILLVLLLGDRRKKPDKGRREAFEMIARELKMTEQQKKQYREMREAHFKQIKPLVDSVKKLKTGLYSMMKDGVVDETKVQFLAGQIGQMQSGIEQEMFHHFRRVRTIFNQEQQPKYDSILIRMIQRDRGRKDSSGKSR
ncbi:MAG: Spy/CpxP family protein refolding chaperone [Chitinophagaceae bacterium]|nr:Spy/CpxP family protein refolding chaperone [Chitinophagaceae bacterium]